jgi:16S rRNA (guanine527-N7)-methyltransferase
LRPADSGDGELGAVPPAAPRLFGARLPLAERYGQLLVTDGVLRGLLGPREAPRIWDRHLLNCAAVAELVPQAATVVDVGSGAGLPGIVLAIARPDLAVTLVEPLARRAAFLSEVVSALGLTGTTVVRSRAEELAGRLPPADVVTARAVAPLDRLVAWCLPLAKMGGRLLAMKGATARDEVAEHSAAIAAAGGGTPMIRVCGAGILAEPATVVEVLRQRRVGWPKQAGGHRRDGSFSQSHEDGGRGTSRDGAGRRRRKR